MKVAFPLLSHSELAITFSKSKYIGIYDDAICKLAVIPLTENNQNFDFQLLFQTMLKQDLNCIVSPFFTFMSLRVFRENKIETLKAEGTSIDENILFLKQNTLKPFVSFDAFKASGCSSSCSSCETETSCKL
jgi:predicted Fe-Mo cluster-binding NifX family protein